MYLVTDNAFAGIEAQKLFIAQNSVTNVLEPVRLVRDLFTADLVLHGFRNSLIDRLAFLVFLVSLPFVYRVVDKPLFIVYVLFGMVPLLGSFMAYTRYLLVAFPMYIAAASALSARSTRLTFGVAGVMFVIQIVLLARHSLNHWVA